MIPWRQIEIARGLLLIGVVATALLAVFFLAQPPNTPVLPGPPAQAATAAQGGLAPFVWHDDARGATCYELIMSGVALSCVPDSQLKH